MENFSKYKLFSITAETGNLSKTAELTGYTQSGVSHILKKLEEEINLTLFVRDRYGVHLTPVGGEFLKYVNSLLAEEEKLKQFIYDTNGFEYGSIRIGTYSSICTHWLPSILNAFQVDHPKVQITLKEGGIKELENWLLQRDVDLILCSNQEKKNYEFYPLRNDELMAVLPYEYGFAGNAFPLKEFERIPSILPESDVDSDIYSLFHKHHITPNIRFTAKDNLTIMAMVEQNLGISIVPSLALGDNHRNVKIVPIEQESERQLGIGLLDEKILSPLAEKFYIFLQNYFKEDE